MKKGEQTKLLRKDISNLTEMYYTKPEIVDKICNVAREKIGITETDLIIEPSAGNGAFVDHIKSMSENYLFFDIAPQHPDIEKQDFLTYNYSEIQLLYSNIHVIGNPPFGRLSSIALKFIKHATNFCDTLTFILPRSFKKDSWMRRFHKHFHLIHQEDLPDNSFIFNKEDRNIRCLFQIWERRGYERELPEKETPVKYSFVDKLETPDITLRRVGLHAGKITTEIDDKNTSSHLFVKFDKDVKSQIKKIVDKMNKVVYSKENTVGPRSVSKQEFIQALNKIIKS
tara:strand:+ start:6394 stop:7245 length:852 start_codon:yes stop_codon:yes gene_type:complete